MNNRSLAIEISKHPLIKRLLEGKLATSSEVARLVVEELLEGNTRDNLIKQVAAARTEKELKNLTQSAHTVFGEDSMNYFNKQVENRRKKIQAAAGEKTTPEAPEQVAPEAGAQPEKPVEEPEITQEPQEEQSEYFKWAKVHFYGEKQPPAEAGPWLKELAILIQNFVGS